MIDRYKIRNIRLSLKLNQQKLAEMSGLSTEYIGKIERGEATNIGIETLEKIAKALKIKFTDLVNEKAA